MSNISSCHTNEHIRARRVGTGILNLLHGDPVGLGYGLPYRDVRLYGIDDMLNQQLKQD